MMRALKMKRFRHDVRGAIAVEFALLAPLLITMMIGVFQMGVYMQNYNAVRSLASDSARYTMIEYQRGNEIDNETIRSVLLGDAVNAPYFLDTDRLVITVTTADTSRVTDAKEINVAISYTLEDFLPFVELPQQTLTYDRPIFVVESSS
uniref:TadE/TadG family type IV pilus assembly protein n=1 Tax=Parerythrobacter lutipelagi TaxID=1964208 RepID=UPI0010F5DB62|nr:TadE/TadG family type IV pilus assembly protein [Parerythrobacter lutipelagi]